MELIPGDLDILVAGTACVDFSGLNTKQKKLEDGGESGSTFHALLKYAERYRPRLLVMENIQGAPWKEFAEAWSQYGYSTVHLSMDTKAYYIPQTRQRGYMACIDNRQLEKLNPADREAVFCRLRKTVKEFARPASSPASSFLLGADERRLDQLEKSLSVRSEAIAVRVGSSWERCKARHLEFRKLMKLGDQRPISRSQPGEISCRGPDFFWQSWFPAQVERVWETLDIKYLLGMINGYDMSFKE